MVAESTHIIIIFFQLILIIFLLFIIYLIKKYNFLCGAARFSDQRSESPAEDFTNFDSDSGSDSDLETESESELVEFDSERDLILCSSLFRYLQKSCSRILRIN